jgi:tRNA-specific 2-thiouridylase
VTPLIAVAVSGGVDSMVAALLLKQTSPDLIALHFRTGFEKEPAARSRQRLDSVRARLGIPLHVVDLSQDFKTRVVDYFCDAYMSGQTPNPCMVCNAAIKFGALLRSAERLGAEALATGHYAALRRDGSGRLRLFKGADPAKDQSYFLAGLSQEQLDKARFPLGPLNKSAVRRIAGRHGLEPLAAEESQDVCFIPEGTYREFIAVQTGHELRPGPIETTDGRLVGRHGGLHRFTVGQRRGINCPAAEPYYVVRLDPAGNRLVVGVKAELTGTACRVVGINWIAPAPAEPARLLTRVRYRTPESPSTLTPLGPSTAVVRFDVPQPALTPGQAAVFYSGDEVLGGGVISGDADT